MPIFIRVPLFALMAVLALALVPGICHADLQFDRKEFVYEATPSEDEFKATYTYRNTGTESVTIKQIKTFCGCLTASVDNPVVKPGEKGTLTGIFSIGKVTGKLTKQIEITTSLPKDAVKMLDVTVNIPELVKITPENGLKWFIGDDAVGKTIRIEVLSEKPIQVKSVVSSRKNVVVGLKTIEEGRIYEINVQPISTKEVTLGYLKILTDCEFEKHRNQMAFFTIMKKKQPK